MTRSHDAPGAQAPAQARDAPPEFASNTTGGSADLSAELAKMGLSPRAAWYSAALLYGVGGLLGALVYAINPALFSRGVFDLGCIAAVIGALCLLAAKRLGDYGLLTESMTHVRLLISLAIYIAGFLVIGDAVIAFALLPLLTVPTPCYLYTWRFAALYSLAAASIVCCFAVVLAGRPDAGPAPVAHALISSFAVIVIAAALIVTKHRTRLLADHNRRLAYTDALTGIANMRSLRERISAELRRPGGDGRPFALFAIDLDDFKQVNDRFDHSLGDRVLCAVANALSEELAPGDLAVRRGGDEFSLFIANPGERDLEQLSERLRRAIVRARIATCPEVTPAGTVAYVRTRPGEEVGAMLERADEALHEAKARARARKRTAPQQPLEPADGMRARGSLAPAPVESPRDHLAEATRSERPRAARRVAARTARTWSSDPLWSFAAALFGAIALAIAGVSLTELVQPLTPALGGAIAAAFLALAVACMWAGKAAASPTWLHVVWVVGYGLIGLAMALAGNGGVGLLDLLPIVALYGFLLFRARTAALYAAWGQAMYGAFAIGGGFPQGLARTLISTVVVAVVGGLVAKLRLVTVRFARTNLELSELDALTGIANMRALQARITDVVERARTLPLHPLLVSIDLDEFKQVNDRYSHSTGDRVLIAVARAVSASVRINELVARRGGDEFVVVINDADPEYADAVVDRIHDAIERTRRRVCPSVRPTASIAPVSLQPGETGADFLHDADIALHEKKAEARSPATLAATAGA